MKKNLFIIIVMMLLICSGLSVTATENTPPVRLPPGNVTMLARDSQQSWFDMTLSDVPVGFDVVNGLYSGWCAQNGVMMTRGVSHTVILYSSYDSHMPESFQCGNWDKVNYILNNKQGGRESIEKVIWYYTCANVYPTDPDAQAMIADADAHGTGFIPQRGQIIAILIDGIPTIQRTFFELTIPVSPQIGDLIWNDLNKNGIQEMGEPGIPDVPVHLYTKTDILVKSTTTDTRGYYGFSDIESGEYYLEFVLPNGFHFSPQDMSADESLDSDVNPSNGRTMVFSVQTDENNSDWDAGMYQQGNPGHWILNHAPTADGTAGEPYKGFVGEEIVFNGSRSYDRDGTIVSWVWDFGDGKTSDSAVVTHVYSEAGTFTVLLIVTDDDGATDTYKTTAQIRMPNRPPSQPQINGPLYGNANISYSYGFVASDLDNDNIRYIIDWGDGSTDTSPLFKNNHEIQKQHTWNAMGFYHIQVVAQDESNATSEKLDVLVSIDVRYVGSLGYLINTDSRGPFDAFYSNSTGNISAVVQENGQYLIDVNGDGQWDHTYNPNSAALGVYPETLRFEYTMLLAGIILVIFIFIVISFIVKRKRSKFQKQTTNANEK